MKPSFCVADRIFEDYNAIVDAVCEDWNRLIARLDLILEKLADSEAEMAALAGKAEVIINKHRHGPTGSAKLHFDGRYIR